MLFACMEIAFRYIEFYDVLVYFRSPSLFVWTDWTRSKKLHYLTACKKQKYFLIKSKHLASNATWCALCGRYAARFRYGIWILICHKRQLGTVLRWRYSFISTAAERHYGGTILIADACFPDVCAISDANNYYTNVLQRVVVLSRAECRRCYSTSFAGFEKNTESLK